MLKLYQVPEKYLHLSLEEECNLLQNDITHIHLKNYHYDANISPKPFIHKALFDGDINFESLLKKTPIDVAHSLEPEVSYEDTILSMTTFKDYIR